MKIFLSHSLKFDYRNKLYKPLQESSLNNQHTIFYLPENGLYPHTKETIKSSDLVVVEVSIPSFGVGIELGWANDANIPIICIYKVNTSLSESLKIISHSFIEYKNYEELTNKLSKIIKTYVVHNPTT